MSTHQVSVIRRNAQFSAIAENCYTQSSLRYPPLIRGRLVGLTWYFPQLLVDGFPGLRGASENRADTQADPECDQEPGGQPDQDPPPQVHVPLLSGATPAQDRDHLVLSVQQRAFPPVGTQNSIRGSLHPGAGNVPFPASGRQGPVGADQDVEDDRRMYQLWPPADPIGALKAAAAVEPVR